MLFTDQNRIDAAEGLKLANINGNYFLLIKGMFVQFIFMHSSKFLFNVDEFFRFFYDANFFQLASENGTVKRVNEFLRPVIVVNSIFGDDSILANKPFDTRIAFLSAGHANQMSNVINNNYKWLRSKFLKLFNADKYTETSQSWRLTHSMFSGSYGDTLMFHLGDWKSNRDNRDNSKILQMHTNLNMLADMLAVYGIKLYFMPSPNKLTIYQDYLVDEIKDKSTFFPRLRLMTDKRYIFIDTEKVLSEMAANGEIDLYFIDDTHW